MLIAVISDTHLETSNRWLSSVYETYLASADVLLHCGDITSYSTYSFFLQHHNFHAVRGNCDWAPQLGKIPSTLSLNLNGLKVGMAHGWGPRSCVATTVVESFSENYDLICYGHTHKRDWSHVNGIQVCNPGSLGEHCSLALISVENKTATACQFISADIL